MPAMLAGARRYAHIAGVRGDAVPPALLGMTKVVSEDAIRRAFKAIGEEEGAAWLRGHLAFCVEPLLAEARSLDVDTTIKPLYGHQEGAVLGYNPKKPGRPSHCYPTYSMASTRPPRPPSPPSPTRRIRKYQRPTPGESAERGSYSGS